MDLPCTSTPIDPAGAAAEQLSQLQLLPDLRARVHCFSETAPDAVIHFQIIDLGQQLYVWIGVGGAKLQNLFLAIQSRADATPSVATLLPDAASSTAASLALRLARRVGRPVVCSCNMPQNTDMLQAIAERRLLQELEQLGLMTASKEAAAAAGASSGGQAAAAAQEQQQQQRAQTAVTEQQRCFMAPGARAGC